MIRFKKEHAPFGKAGLPELEVLLEKREYFAAMAMQGLLTRIPNRHNGETDLGIIECKRIADESVIMADELLRALAEKV